MNFRSISQLDLLIRKNIFLIPKDIDYVVGVPRSGMIPATIIATLINKPLLTIDQYINNETDLLKVSYRSENNIKYNRILIVEDSCNTGNSIRIIRDNLSQCAHNDGMDCIFMCIYATSTSKEYVDIFLEICEQPRMFEWNIMNHYFIQQSCFDMDGILCIDPTDEQNDDGDKYIDFILNAKPLYIPKFKIGAIVTSRLEKYRKYTEEWLDKNNVQYENLIMLDLPDKETRIRMGAHAPFKASVYNIISNSIMFYESNDLQASQIAEITHKPVYCVESNKMYHIEDEAEKENSFDKYLSIKVEIDEVINKVDGLFEYIEEGIEFLQNKKECKDEETIDIINAVIECINCVMDLYKKYNLSNNDISLTEVTSLIASGNLSNEYEDMIHAITNIDYRHSRLLLTIALMNRVREYSGKVSVEDWNKENLDTRNEIINFINSKVNDTQFEFHNEIEHILRKGELELYPYSFTEKYSEENVEVLLDSESQYKYVMHNGKRLYFPPKEDSLIKHEYNQLIMEQDKKSPHCYFTDEFNVDENTVFIDVGAAEAIVSLDIIDKVKELYLIECDKNWIKALELTFKNYKDKVHIIPKYAGYIENDTISSIDTILSGYTDQKIFIKMDIEGMELECLESCCSTMKNNQCYLACTTYHSDDSEMKLKSFFDRNNYTYEMSDGYMLFYWGRLSMLNGYYKRPIAPYFRKCLIRAKR